MDESPKIMVLHGVLIGIAAYAAMLYVVKQPTEIAEQRAVLLGASSIIYMTLFGHNLPFRGSHIK